MSRPRVRSLLFTLAILPHVGCAPGDERTDERAAQDAAPIASTSRPAARPASPCAVTGPAAFTPGSFAPGLRAPIGSAIALVRADRRTLAIVADPEERALHTVDVDSMTELAVTPMAGRPGHVMALEDGRIVVTLRDVGRVVVLEPAAGGLAHPLVERCAVEVAAEPWSLAAAPDRLLVTSGTGAALTLLHLGDLSVDRVVPLAREPRAVLVDEGTGTAFVSHAVGGHLSAIDLADPDAPPDLVDLRAGARRKMDGSLDRARPREATQGYALASVEGERAVGGRGALRILAPHASVDPGAPEGSGRSSGYGGELGVLPVVAITSVVDPIARRSLTDDVALASGGRGSDCRLPRAAVVADEALFVACLDLDVVVELDAELADPSSGERRRHAVAGGPSSLALTADGRHLLVHAELDGTLHRLTREGGASEKLALWRRAGVARDRLAERGRRLFHTSKDVRLAGGRACASCHPDGRDDGLVWTSPAGPRQTPALAGRLEGTAPFGWFGEHRTLREHVADTLQRLGGTGLEAPAARDDLDALVHYVATLPPPPGASVERPVEDGAVTRGKAVYLAYGCQGCHPGGGSDGQRHDVGSGAPGERSPHFDTPSLLGVRGSAPYFHDGRHATLDAVLTHEASKMFPGTIPTPDRVALLTYLETL